MPTIRRFGLLAPPAVVARSGTPFGGQQRANDCFARVGFVNVDLVDHGPIVVHNAAGQPCHFSVPAPRAFSAEQSRRSIDTEHASSAESFQRTPKLLVEVCDSHLIVGSVT